MILVFACMLLTQVDMRPGAIRPPQPPAVEDVYDTFRRETDLLADHLSYRAYLQAHPALGDIEAAYVRDFTQAPLKQLEAAFDEALVQDPMAGAAFDAYYSVLAARPTLVEAIDSLHRWELSGDADPALASALDYLRGQPDVAQAFLQAPGRFSPLPDALKPLATLLTTSPDVRESLASVFAVIGRDPLAAPVIYPWWMRAYGESDRVAPAHGALMSYLRLHPELFWTWHRRNLALATDPVAQRWIPYWHRSVRRNETLEADYWNAVWPAENSTEESFFSRFTELPATPWPVDEAPPMLEPTAGSKVAGEAIEPEPPRPPMRPLAPQPVVVRPQRPDRPDFSRPGIQRVSPQPPYVTAPKRPIAPVRPTRPVRSGGR